MHTKQTTTTGEKKSLQSFATKGKALNISDETMKKNYSSFFRASYAHVFSLHSLIKCDHFDQRQVNERKKTSSQP